MKKEADPNGSASSGSVLSYLRHRPLNEKQKEKLKKLISHNAAARNKEIKMRITLNRKSD